MTRAIIRLGHGLVAIAIAAMIAITLVDVVARGLFNRPIVGVVDVIELSMIWLTMLGIALAWAERAHIVVDIIDTVVSPRIVRRLDQGARLVTAAVMGYLAWLAVPLLEGVADFGDTTMNLRLPLTWFWAAIIFGYGVSCLVLIGSLFSGPPANET